MTRKALAAALKCSGSLITEWEAGTRTPGRELSHRIEALTGIPSAAWNATVDVPPGPTADGQTQAGAPDEQPDADDRRLPRTTFATVAA